MSASTFMLLLLLSQLQGCHSATYYTYGDKQLFIDEGTRVQSISGYKSVIDISSKECAQGCLSMRDECGCCDSFTYNTFRRECYLKLKGFSSTATTFNSDGWQSYTFNWGFGSTAVDNVEPLQSTLGFLSSAYMHKGFNRLAVNEGISLQTFDGKQFLSQVTPDDCAEGCNRLSNCNSFAYNPNVDGGKCYLKLNIDSSRTTTYNSAGWRTFWKDFTGNCFCTCRNNNYCVICVLDDVCFER